MRKVIVTGAAGYIGSHTVVELAKAGYLPVVVDNFVNSERGIIDRLRKLVGSNFPVYEVDCTDERAFDSVLAKEGAIFGLIHFAAHKAVSGSVKNPLLYYDNNVGSLVSVLKSMLNAGISTLVFSSSATVYGQPDTLPVSERSGIKAAESPYGRTKQICEAVLDDVVSSGAHMRSVTLRYFNPIGAHPSGQIGELPRGKPDNLVPYITQTAVGLRPQLNVFGNDYPTPDGTCIRDYIHVVDLARAHVLALNWISTESRPVFNEVFNVGTGCGTSVLEAIAAFEDATGISLDYRIGERRSGDVASSYADVAKAEQLLGYVPQLPLVEAMRDAYNWQLMLRDHPL